MKAEDILEEARRRIRDHAGNDPDKWFYANRYVYARLQLDERKTKTDIKKNLFKANVPCHYCGKPFEKKTGVHLHRLDEERGYSNDNCALMHPDCHQKHHADNPRKVVSGSNRSAKSQDGGDEVLEKSSKRYPTGKHIYWWDFSPNFVERSKQYDEVRFLQKDSGASYTISTGTLLIFLTQDRRTSRGNGNWGVRVLRDRPNELAFEPPSGSDEWLYLKVRWEG